MDLTPDELAQARAALGAVIQAIDSGALDGDAAQRAHLADAVEGLRADTV